MRKDHNIRASLVSDRELQPGFKKRIHKEAFGIYRPLTNDSYQQVYDILVDAKEEIDDFLTKRRNTSASVTLPDQMGITFVGLQSTRKTMRHKSLLQRGFDVKQLQHSVDEYNEKIVSPLEVPIDELDWYSYHQRRLVGKFALGEGFAELQDNSESISELLNDARGGQLRVMQPDHVSLFKYGRRRDNMDLSHKHRNEVSDIVLRHLEVADIGAVMLDKIVVGKTYTQPISIT